MTENQNSQPLSKDSREYGERNTLSLRAKLLMGNLLIVLIAVAAMGYFVFFRSQAEKEFLIDQFDISVTREIENRLTIITSDEVNDINIFFSSMKNVIETFGTTAGALISTDNTISPEEADWNAYIKLKRLPNGSWDNADNEYASIFLPAKMEISEKVAEELVALKGLDYFTQGLLEENPDIIAIYFGGKSGETVYYPNIDLAAVVPPDFDITSRPWYLNATELSAPDINAVWSVPYQDAALNGLVITGSVPVFDNTGAFRGVVGADLLLSNITSRIDSLSIGKTGYGFLIDAEGRLVAMPSKGYDDFNLTEEEIQSGDVENLSLINRVSLEVFEVLAKMTSGQKGVRLVSINGSNRYIAYKPIPIIGYSFGVVVNEDELLEEFVETSTIFESETKRTILNSIGVIVVLLSITSLASYGMGYSLTAPLGTLTKAAKEVANGNLDARAEVNTRDEIGVLGNTLNSMTSTAQELVTNLEDVVSERTRAIEKRATQIQAVAEVGQAVAAQRELEELLLRTTHLISNRFGYYHVGIFLLDARGEYAVLRAANSSGGAKMLARGHKLRVGAEGIVGTVTASGEARIALDVGEDAVYFDNPDMPNTRSEMALPLIAAGEILGALDIQSVKDNAFSPDDIPILQVLADQLSTAVQNARMLRETQEALITARKATGEVSERGWRNLLRETEIPGYISRTHGELAQIKDAIDKNTEKAIKEGRPVYTDENRSISLPIIVRGQTVAMMRLAKPSHLEPWTTDEITDIELLSVQISNALESARLFSDAQRRAAQEQAIGEMTAKIGATSSIDAILRSTVQEIGHQLGDTEIVLELEVERNE
jgi:GAF domain-containing protein/HAMP domain-containing protein